MNLERLQYLVPLDVDVITSSFMALYLEHAAHDPAAEEIIAWTTTKMGEYGWKDPSHYMYEWLMHQASIAIDEHKKWKKDNEVS